MQTAMQHQTNLEAYIMNTTLHTLARNLTTVIIVILFCTSLWQLATAGWVQGKAIIAQQLLNHSWQKTLIKTPDKKAQNKPWPWADTWPVAKLIVPQHHIEQVILAGDSGSSLAFAPGHSFASAKPNTPGTTVISGHRDTHFRFLKDMKIDEKFFIQTSDKTMSYLVYDLQIVNSKTYTILQDSDEQRLVLVTCYPFDAISMGGSLRYLVYARPISLT